MPDPSARVPITRDCDAIRIPPELQLSAAARLVNESPATRSQAARRLVTAAAIHGIDLSLMWGTIDRATDGRPVRVRQVCLAIPGAGKTATMLVSGPGAWPAVLEHAERISAIRAACATIQGDPTRVTRLAQALPDPRDDWAVCAFIEAGFVSVGDLAYMRRPLHPLPEPPSSPWPEGISLRTVTSLEHDRADLIDALDRSYVDTLDCPDLCGLRETADVLESHLATGRWDRNLWWIVTLRGQPEGCMLFNPCPDHDCVELVYLGLSPALRSRRLGSTLLQYGLSRLSAVGGDHVACAVDLRNVPARRLYEHAGFRESGRRVAMVRPLRT